MKKPMTLRPVPFSAARERNAENAKTDCRCLFCEKDVVETDDKVWVEMTTDNELVPAGYATPVDSMGFYMVGGTCAKKVPAAYRRSLPA